MGAEPVMVMNGFWKPSKVSVYLKLNSLLVTFAFQFGFGHVKVARNFLLVVPVADSVGTSSRPFFVGVRWVGGVGTVVDFENGSTTMLFEPGF